MGKNMLGIIIGVAVVLLGITWAGLNYSYINKYDALVEEGKAIRIIATVTDYETDRYCDTFIARYLRKCTTFYEYELDGEIYQGEVSRCFSLSPVGETIAIYHMIDTGNDSMKEEVSFMTFSPLVTIPLGIWIIIKEKKKST